MYVSISILPYYVIYKALKTNLAVLIGVCGYEFGVGKGLILNMVSELGELIPDRCVARKKGLIASFVIRQRKTNARNKVFGHCG